MVHRRSSATSAGPRDSVTRSSPSPAVRSRAKSDVGGAAAASFGSKQSQTGELSPIIERFLSSSPTLGDIAVHRLELLTVASLCERRLAVPPRLAAAARDAA